VEKPHFTGIFARHLKENSVFSAFFAVSLLRSPNPLAIVPNGPSLFGEF
jgi:hypothetical protein